MRYKVTRRRDKSGRWASEYEFGDPVARFAGSAPRLSRVARAVAEPGKDLVFYDSKGRVIGPPQARLSAPSGRASEPNRIGPAELRSLVGGEDTSRAWIGKYLVTEESSRRERAMLGTRIGAAPRDSGRSRFVQRRGNVRAEIDLNDERGTVDVIRILADNRLVQEGRREYTREDGVWLLRSERIARFSGENAPPRVTVITYRNVRLWEEK